MGLLKDILYTVRLEEVVGSTDKQIANLHLDSRNVGVGDLFFAIKGLTLDGHQFIAKAIELGASAIVCENLPDKVVKGVTYIMVKNAAEASGIVAANFYNHPSEKLKLVGVTGTNGKTSVASLLFDLYTFLGNKCGMVSTIHNVIGNEIIPATHTTPNAINLQKLLAQMVDANCAYCFMEVSSHAIDQKRISGAKFTGGIFTNISHDHLDYHKTFDEYIRVKKLFFDGLSKDAFALSNVDDKRGKVMLQNTVAKKHTYSLNGVSDFKAKILENTFSGLLLQVDHLELHSRLIGKFNAYNVLSVYGAAVLLGTEPMEALRGLSALKAPEGRFDFVISEKEKIVGIIDYAHTPDALRKVLETIASIRTGAEKVITVVGCGGDRDKTKRPIMASVACELSDQAILTSDNPRSEVPETIIEEMKAGVPPHNSRKVLTQVDRAEAIKTAVMLSGANDIVLIAGKGHEKYQIIGDEKLSFDDKEILLTNLKELNK